MALSTIRGHGLAPDPLHGQGTPELPQPIATASAKEKALARARAFSNLNHHFQLSVR
jgi:hypothetical protein